MLSIIVAKAKNNIIGKDNTMLWKLPDDLKRFKEKTTGHTIIMGRKTFESLGGILPNRMHIILSRNPDFNIDSDYVKVVHSLLELQPYMAKKCILHNWIRILKEMHYFQKLMKMTGKRFQENKVQMMELMILSMSILLM